MINLPLRLHMPILARKQSNKTLWDRFPCASVGAPDLPLLFSVVGCPIYAFSFCIAWNYTFPTQSEQLVWRVCAVYHGCYATAASIYYIIASWSFIKKGKQRLLISRKEPSKGLSAWFHLPEWLTMLRNLSLDHDPDLYSPLRVILPWTVGGALFCLSRAYLYTEDFISLRTQPAGVYITVSGFMPFISA